MNEETSAAVREVLHRYRVFGLRVASQIVLPELTPDRDRAAPADVAICRGNAGAPPENGRKVGDPFTVAAQDCLIEVDRVARYRVCAGNRLIVEPATGAPAQRVRLNLLGSALGMLCHQRSILPLHASVVEIDGQCHAFMGPSGAGKSTVAAALQARGAQLLGDDICAIDFPQYGPALAWPGVRRVKLWDDSAQALGQGARTASQRRSEKLQFAASGAVVAHDPRPLRGLYVLSPGTVGDDVVPRTLSGADALNALLGNSFRPAVMTAMGIAPANLAQCAELVRRCPVFGLERPSDLAALGWFAERLEQHLRRIGASAHQRASGK